MSEKENKKQEITVGIDETNRNYKNSKEGDAVAFRAACSKIGVPATGRQASKWRNGVGIAYKYSKGLLTEKEVEAAGFKVQED